MTDKITLKKQKQKIFILYIIFFLSIFAIFVPISFTSIFASMISICTLAVIYSVRSNSEEDSLTENHMTYLIRTFWRANLYFIISFILSSLYLTLFASYAPLMPCIGLIEANITTLITGNSSDIMRYMSACLKPFLNDNLKHFIVSVFIALSPIMIYLSFRGLRGWVLLTKNKLIPHKKL